MFYRTDDVIRAEIAYRQARIAEQFRRANGRRGRRTAAPKHSARRAA
ncbi:MAG TPA: hypothetical protein VGJ44_23765 [Kribbellaceae bacterium]|jgi:hypothetical protein